MQTEPSEIARLNNRVLALERRQKFLQLLGALAIACAVLVGAAPTEPTIKILDEDALVVRSLITESIVVVGSLSDVAETARIEISAVPQPRVAILERDGLPGVSLTQTKKASGLGVVETGGEARTAYLGIGDSATGAREAELMLGRRHEKVAAAQTNEFGGIFGVFDTAGRARGAFGMGPSGPVVGVNDEAGRMLP